MNGIVPLITMFLFFILVAGIVTIYHEEILKMEFFARLHTTAIPATEAPQLPTAKALTVPELGTKETAFSTNRNVSFGNSRIVDTNVRDVDTITKGTVLHTISGGVSDYYARGFLEETERLYRASPHAGSVVFLDRTKGVEEYRPDREYLILLVSNVATEPVTITDWRIFDRNEKIAYKLPQGVEVLGTTGKQSPGPIRVKKGGTVIVSSGRSPTGYSFRVNKCSGYRSQFKKFTPTIKTDCPKPLDEFISDGTVPYTDNRCYEIVNRTRACIAFTDIPSSITDECADFLKNTLNEKGCVTRHRNDVDFFTSEWRVFLDSETELWKNKNNILYLLDEQGHLVATLVYK